MPFPTYDQWTFSGVFGSTSAPVEIWSFSIKCQPTVGDQVGAAASAADGNTAYGFLQPIMPSSTILTRVRYSKHGSDGRVLTDTAGAYLQADSAATKAGTKTGATIYPLQVALCVSLLSDRAGSVGKGRFFLPAPGFALGADYRMSTADQVTTADAVESFLNALHVEGTTPLVVASSKGTRSEVQRFKLGRVMDTQRSRRSALLEGYLTRNVS
jgi:hypothetical protein